MIYTKMSGTRRVTNIQFLYLVHNFFVLFEGKLFKTQTLYFICLVKRTSLIWVKAKLRQTQIYTEHNFKVQIMNQNKNQNYCAGYIIDYIDTIVIFTHRYIVLYAIYALLFAHMEPILYIT